MTRTLRWALAALLAISASAMAPAAEAKGPTFYPGDHVVLVLRDSSRVSGEFVDLGRLSLEEYRDPYARWRQVSSDGAVMPELGSRIELVTGRITATRNLSFCGLAHEGVDVRKGEGAIHTVQFERFAKLIGSAGGRVESGKIRDLCRGGEVPLVTTIQVRAADATRAVPIDDVAGVESETTPEWIDVRQSAFKGVASTSTRLLSLQGGGLWAGDPSDRGQVASGLYARVSPGFVTPRLGLDFAVGFVQDKHQNPGLDTQLALCGTLPLGSRFGIAPRVGVGILAGPGLALASGTFGTGLMMRLGRDFGLRADLTYSRLGGTGLNYWAIQTLQVGPYWGR